MIRVLQVVTHMNRGGLETMLMNYYRHIDRRRVQFDFLVHRAERADYDDEIESLGGKIYRLPRLVPWSLSYHKALDSFFETHPEYQIIHVHQDCLSSVILKAAKKHGVPVRIAHSHCANQDKDLKYPIKLCCKKWIPTYATNLFACGRDAGRWMFGGAPFQILNNAIDAKAYAFSPHKRAEMRAALGLPHEAFVVGHVGRFSPPKNHDGLLAIFEEIHRRDNDAVLLLVGDDRCELGNKIHEKVKSLGLENHVIFTGVRSDVNDLLQAMNVFVFPSRYEGLPVTMVEAQAAGLPCYISDHVPPECALTDLVTTIPLSASPETWAGCILTARTDRVDTYDEIAAAGFDIAENAKWLQNYYEEAHNRAQTLDQNPIHVT